MPSSSYFWKLCIYWYIKSLIIVSIRSYIFAQKNRRRKTKVVSTTLSLADFDLLKKYARINYEVNALTLPTVCHMLRRIVKNWVYHEAEGKKARIIIPPYMGTELVFYWIIKYCIAEIWKFIIRVLSANGHEISCLSHITLTLFYSRSGLCIFLICSSNSLIDSNLDSQSLQL